MGHDLFHERHTLADLKSALFQMANLAAWNLVGQDSDRVRINKKGLSCYYAPLRRVDRRKRPPRAQAT
jgi:hypothetical protein